MSLLKFHADVLAFVNSIGRQADVIGLKTSGYVSASVVRKIILAEMCTGRWAEALMEMRVKELIDISVDEGDYRSCLDKDLLVGDLSHLCFSEKRLGAFVQLFYIFVA